MEYELQHHGIQGQKWGVKNGPPYPLDESDKSTSEKKTETVSEYKGLTESQKKAIKIGLIATGASIAVIGGMYVIKKSHLSPTHIATYSIGKIVNPMELSDKQTILKKGTEFQRISSKSFEDYAEEGKSIFVSYLKNDNAIYKNEMPRFLNDWKRQGVIENFNSPYVHKLVSNKDIKIASERDVLNLYLKVNNLDKADHANFRKAISALSDRNNPDTVKLLKAAKAAGFDGLIDLNDSEHFAKSPVILINPSECIGNIKSHKLTEIEKFINVITS